LYELKDARFADQIVNMLTLAYSPLPKTPEDLHAEAIPEVARLRAEISKLEAGDGPSEPLSSPDGPSPGRSSRDRIIVKAEGAYVLSYWGRDDGVSNQAIDAFFSDVFGRLKSLSDRDREPAQRGTGDPGEKGGTRVQGGR
jgi:hypothetical protein